MRKRKGKFFFSIFSLCILLCFSFAASAFAYAEDTGQELPVTEETPPESSQPVDEISEGEPIQGEGNAFTRDLLYDKASNKQFITVQTKNGNTFYLVIDYDAPINEEEEQYQAYFLNLVDEQDLLSLMDEKTAEELTTCTCDIRCEAGAVNEECPVCKTAMSECTGIVPEPDPPAEVSEPEPNEPESSSNLGWIIGGIVVLGLGGGAAYCYFKFVRGKKEDDEELDFFDDDPYEEMPEISEDEEVSEEDQDTT